MQNSMLLYAILENATAFYFPIGNDLKHTSQSVQQLACGELCAGFGLACTFSGSTPY